MSAGRAGALAAGRTSNRNMPGKLSRAQSQGRIESQKRRNEVRQHIGIAAARAQLCSAHALSPS